MKKILILKPAYSARGGISNYYKVIENKFSMPVEYFDRGARNWPNRNTHFTEILRSMADLLNFIGKLSTFQYNIIQTSTSLGSFSVIRDGFFILFAKLFGRKVIIFFRGWDENFERVLIKRYFFFFKRVFFSSDAIIVLSSLFKKKIEEWGYKKKIYVETTVVEDNIIGSINKDFLIRKYSDLDRINILFLARVEKPKGIYEAISTFQILKKKYSKLTLIIAGDGFEMDNVINYVGQNEIEDVEIKGYVSGDDRVSVYRISHIYFLPTYSEGMPNSILEAMAMGLPVISRQVGGLVDILKDSETGFTTKSLDPYDFALLFERFFQDKELLNKISLNNFCFARENFSARQVIMRLEKIYKSV